MKRKLCFFTTYYDFARQRLLTYYEEMLPKDIEIFLFCQEKEKEKFKTKRAQKIGYSKKKIFVAHYLRNFCKKNKIHFLINLSGYLKSALVMSYATLFSNTKNIIYTHGNPTYYNHILLFPLQFFFNRILSTSPDISKKMKKYFFFSKRKTFYLIEPIDTDSFKIINKESIKRKLKLDKKDKIILFVGRIHYSKGSDYLLKIIQQNPDKKFILIGQLMDDNYKINELKNIIYIPQANTEELREYYNASDLYLFLSRGEGVGFTFREAMSCGTSAITFNIESVKTVENTIKVPENINEIQKAIDSFFNLSKKEKKILSNKSRKEMLEKYSLKSLKEDHINMFLNF